MDCDCMTQEELIRELNFLKNEAMMIIYTQSPKRTQTLARSFKVIATDNGFTISTDIHYMKYVEEAWQPGFAKGRKNPNQGWFEQSIQFIIKYIEARLGVQFIRG